MSDAHPHPEPQQPAPRPARRWRRIARVVLRVFLASIVVLLVVLVALLAGFNLSSGLREKALAIALDQVRAALPGTLELEARWPHIGTLEVHRLKWIGAPDTLVTVDFARVVLDLDAAVQRRIRVEAVQLEGVDARVPAIRKTLAARSADPAATIDTTSTTEPASLPWFDAGRFAGLPDARIEGLVLRRIRARLPEQDVVVDSLAAQLDLAPQSTEPWIRADLRVTLPTLATVDWRLEGDLGDSITVRFAPLALHAEAPSEVRASTTTELTGSLVLPRDLLARAASGELGNLRWQGVLVDGGLGTVRSAGHWTAQEWHASLDVVAPERTGLLERVLARAALDTIAVVRTALDTWPGEDRYALRARVSGRGTGFVRGHLDLDVEPWLRRATVSGSWDGHQAVLDTFVVEREGLAFAGAGRVDRETVDARVRFDVDTEAIARGDLQLPLPADLSLRARGSADARGAWPLPALDFAFDARASGAFGAIPAVSVRGRHRDAATTFDARLGEPATLQGRTLDTAALYFDGTIDAQREEVHGRIGVRTAVDDVRVDLASRVRASRAAGLEADVDTLRVEARAQAWELAAPFSVWADTTGAARIRGLALRGEPGFLRLDAETAGDSLELDTEAQLTLTRALLETLLPDSLHARVPADSTQVLVRAQARGPRDAPSARVHLEVALEGNERIAPVSLRSDLWLRAAGRLDFSGAPEELPARGVAGHAEVLYAGTPWLNVEAATAGHLDLAAARFVPASPESAQVDVVASDVDLATLATLVQSPLTVRGVLDGRIAGGVGSARAQADVDVGIRGFGVQQTDGSWWESEIALRLDGRGSLAGEVEVDSLRLVTRLGQVRGHGRYFEEATEARLEGDLRLPRSLIETLLARSMEYDFPADTLAVHVELAADGPSRAPSGYAQFVLGLRGPDELPPLELRATTWLRGDTEAMAVLPWPGSAPQELPERGVFARLRLAHADSVWVHAESTVPAEVGLTPLRFESHEDRPLVLDLDTKSLDVAQLADLADLDAFGDFSGDLRVRMHAEASAGRTSFDGSVDSRKLRVELPEGSWMQARAGIRLAGDQENSRVDGGVTIEGGVLRMPDVPPPLFDTEGTALLWERPRPTTSQADSTATSPAAEPARATFVPDLDVTLAIPGNLRLRGTGLDVELSGHLSARTVSGEPALVGELRATRGSYEFLGRRFTVRSGEVIFYGDLDPQLDLRLSTTLQSSTYFIQMRGTVQSPRFELSAEPPQSEGDIVSSLLFGRPIDELDEGQTQLLRQRTQEVAAQLGANLLAQRIGQQIGVDVLALQPSSDTGEQALVVGKYLSPDVLVTYEQVLEEGRAALVRIEYALSRFFRVETTASQGDHSGIELKWSRDY